MEQTGVNHLQQRERELAEELQRVRTELLARNREPAQPRSADPFEEAGLYRAILRGATDYAIIATDIEGRIVEWNVGARHLLGWSRDEIVGQDIRVIFTPEDREAGVPERAMRDAVEQGGTPDRRWHLKRDGSRFWADGRMMTLKGNDDAIRGYLKVLRDEPEETAKAPTLVRDDAFRTLADTLDIAIIQVDAAARVISTNPAVEHLLGWASVDLHGRDLTETIVLRDGANAGSEAADLLAVLRTGQAMRDCVAALRKRDGTPANLSCSSLPLLVDGEIVGAVLTAQDTSAHKVAEDGMRSEIERQQALQTIQHAAEGGAGHLEHVLSAVVSGAKTMLRQADNVVIELIDGDDCVYRTVLDPAYGAVGTRVPLGRSLSGSSLALGRPVVCDDIQTDNRAGAEPTRHMGIRSVMTVPVSRLGLLVGTLKVMARKPAAFGPDDLLIAQILAGYVATGFAQADEARALRSMQRSEERLQLALQASETIGIWDWDVETDLCFADPRFARLFSVDAIEAAGGLPIARFADGVHPDDRIWVGIAARKALAEGGDYAMEHRVKLGDGSVRWVAARGRIYYGPTGKPVRFPGAVVDITERKRVETSLRTAETNARLAVNAAGLGLWDYDLAADAMVWDERSRTIFGIEDAVVPTLDLVMFGIRPESRERLRTTVQTALAAGRLVDQAHEFEITRANDGDHRWVEVSAQAFFSAGRCTRVIGTMADITDRKRLHAALREDEERFRGMAESIPQLAWMASPSGEIVWLNERWLDYTGTSLEDMRTHGWPNVIHRDAVETVTERLQAAFRGGTTWDDTIPLRGKDGAFRWFLSRALPIRGTNGAILRWLGTHTDIDDQIQAREAQARFGEDLERQVVARTQELVEANARLLAEMAERRRAEEALRQSQKMEAEGQLTGGIAHDFNNLLTGITGSLDLMRKRIEQGRIGDLDRYMTAAAGSANRAAALTHRLLAFARRQPLDAKPVDANALVASMEDLFHRTLGETIEIAFDLPADLWTTFCDPHQLENALLNLVINARDAMPDGGRLVIRTANRDIDVMEATAVDGPEPGRYVAVEVGDTGVGMTPDTMARVFEPFFTTKPIGQGTGLGLSMIYGFARQSEGSVDIRSRPGEGTTFTLLLPRFQGSEPSVEGPSSSTLPITAEGETVLVVEDDMVVRNLVLDVLRDLGYRTLDAQDGMAALAILQGRERVDLLVTDVGLPGLNGRQLVEMARASRPALKVLFITGYAEDAAFGQGVADTAVQMIPKPFAIEALAAKIREMIKA